MRSTNKPASYRVANGLMLGVFALAGYSQIKLQVVDRENTLKLASATKAFVTRQAEPARRGEIITSDGKKIAKDSDNYDLVVDFTNCPNTPAFWIDVSRATGVPATELEDLATAKVTLRAWPQILTAAHKSMLASVQRMWRANGISAAQSGHREYPMGASTACLVGVLRRKDLVIGPEDKKHWDALVQKEGKPEEGKPFVKDFVTGLEKSKNAILAGKDGVRTGLKDRNGQFLPMETDGENKPKVDGQSITLTLNSRLQSLATEVVKKTVEQYQADSAVAVVLDPKTGDLLALANWPSFEPYKADGSYNSLGEHGGLNQAYQSVLEPGSMFKVLTLAEAIETGKVNLYDRTYCSGEWSLVSKAKPIRCDDHAGNRAHGDINCRDAIGKSCNISAARWALKIGQPTFDAFLKKIGLLDKPGLGLPGEQPALYTPNDGNITLHLAIVGYGQSINCTPVALASAFSTIANGGIRMQPRVVQAIDGKEVAPVEAGRLFSQKTCEDVTSAMEAVFEPGGTAYALDIPGYHLAGKTGTAQKKARKVTGHVSNFIGFVPARNPRAVIMVMVDRPVKSIYGAAVAGPAFREIAQGVIHEFDLPSDPEKMRADLARKPNSKDGHVEH